MGLIILYILAAFVYSLILTKKRPIKALYDKRKSAGHFCSYDKLPYKIIDIVLSLEDAKFFKHNGYDLIAIKNAFFRNIKQKRIVFGGSTITQQLAKNLYLSFKPFFFRKLSELFLSLNIEKNLTKIEILEMYLNIIYYGNNQYGIYDAADYYFNKNCEDLTVNQSFFLICLLSAPTAANPLKNPNMFTKVRNKKIGQVMWIGEDKKYIHIILDHNTENLDEELVKHEVIVDNKAKMINEKYNRGVF